MRSLHDRPAIFPSRTSRCSVTRTTCFAYRRPEFSAISRRRFGVAFGSRRALGSKFRCAFAKIVCNYLFATDIIYIAYSRVSSSFLESHTNKVEVPINDHFVSHTRLVVKVRRPMTTDASLTTFHINTYRTSADRIQHKQSVFEYLCRRWCRQVDCRVCCSAALGVFCYTVTCQC